MELDFYPLTILKSEVNNAVVIITIVVINANFGRNARKPYHKRI